MRDKKYPEVEQRNADLRKAMIAFMKENNRFEWNMRTPCCRLAMQVVDGGAPRFYISEHKARRIVYYFRLGRATAKGTQRAWNRHADFYRVYCSLKRQNDALPIGQRKTDSDIIRDAIESPAPSYYCPNYLAARIMIDVMNSFVL